MTARYDNDGILQFGKHSGESIYDLAEHRAGKNYLRWLLDQDWIDDDLESDIEDALSEAEG